MPISGIPIVKEISDVFKKQSGLPPCRETEHKIEILGTLPKPTPIYKCSTFKDEISEILKKRYDQESYSSVLNPYIAAVIFVYKKDGSLRLVTDYWALNVVNYL